MIPTFESQLAWIAQGEPLSRTDDQRHEVERQLEQECLDRQHAEQERKALAGRLEAEERLREVHGRPGGSEGSWNVRNHRAAIPCPAVPFHQFL